MKATARTASMATPKSDDLNMMILLVRTELIIAMLAADRAAAPGEQVDHRPVERWQIVRLPARHPVTVVDNFAVEPMGSGVADIILESVVAGHSPPAHEIGRNQLPRRVTDGRENPRAPNRHHAP